MADAAERAEYGALCYSKRLYTTAARFYEQAFAEQPDLAEDLARGHRYTAACSAALAASGQREDSSEARTALDDTERRLLREQALGGLHADLAQYANVLKSDDAKSRQLATQQLQHWQVDPDLAYVREVESLKKLPDAEQELWRKLWADVAKALNGRIGQ